MTGGAKSAQGLAQYPYGEGCAPIATAMAIWVNSWPAGIALSLLTLPSIGAFYGVNAVYVFVTALTAGGIALTFAYNAPANAAIAGASSARPGVRPLMVSRNIKMASSSSTLSAARTRSSDWANSPGE